MKKPASLWLLVLCTSQSLITQPSHAQPYYPLQVGNHWQYRLSSWSIVPPTGSSWTRDVQVVRDTTMPNGRTYFSLSVEDLTGLRFVRVDSAGVYYYWEVEEREGLVYKSDAVLYDMSYSPELGPAWWVALVTIDTVELFGERTVIREFRVDGLILYWVTLSDKFGPIRYYSTGEPPGTEETIGELTGAILSDTLYGTVPVRDGPRHLPVGYDLHQNYPNPFNPSTTIRYELPTRTTVVLKIFNVVGQEVATLVDQEKEAGRHSVRWDAGQFVSGVYFYRMQAGEFVETSKLLFLK